MTRRARSSARQLDEADARTAEHRPADAVTDAQEAADLAAVGTDDLALQDALEAMANKPVDDEVMDWAKGILGVGEENVGKIDEMREVLEAAAEEEAAAEAR